MSEPFDVKLSRFTPASAGLDRDALLLAAGRASARPSRLWKTVAGILGASQVLTLALLWPRAVPPVPSLVVAPSVQPAPEVLLAPVTADRPPINRSLFLAEGDDFAPPAPVDGLVRADPPLRALSTSLPGLE